MTQYKIKNHQRLNTSKKSETIHQMVRAVPTKRFPSGNEGERLLSMFGCRPDTTAREANSLRAVCKLVSYETWSERLSRFCCCCYMVLVRCSVWR